MSGETDDARRGGCRMAGGPDVERHAAAAACDGKGIRVNGAIPHHGAGSGHPDGYRVAQQNSPPPLPAAVAAAGRAFSLPMRTVRTAPRRTFDLAPVRVEPGPAPAPEAGRRRRLERHAPGPPPPIRKTVFGPERGDDHVTRASDAMDRGDAHHERRTERESGGRCGGKSRERSAGRERAGQESGRPEHVLDRGPGGAGGSGRESEHENAAGSKPKTPDVDLGMSLPPSRFRPQRWRRPANTAATHAAPARRSRASWRPLTRRRRGRR